MEDEKEVPSEAHAEEKDKAEKAHAEPVAPAPSTHTDEDLNQALDNFLTDPSVSEDEKTRTQKGYNRLTEAAKARKEEADRVLAESREQATREAAEIKAKALKDAEALNSVAIAKTMVKKKFWTKEQANEYLESEGIDQEFDPDTLLTKVADVVARTVAEQREADKRAAETARIASERPLWVKAMKDVATACPNMDLDEVSFYLGKQYNAGKKPDEAVEAITKKFGKAVAPTAVKEDELPAESVEAIEAERKSLAERLGLVRH